MHVNGEAGQDAADRSGRIYLGKRNGAPSQFLGWKATADNAGYYEFGAGDVTVNGKVGIGTTSPSTLLNVYKNQYNVSDIIASIHGGALHVNGEAGQDAADRSGRIYLGKRNGAPSQFLGWKATADNVGYYEFGAGDVTVNGNVGIGTTTPGAKLQVDSAAGAHLVLKKNSVYTGSQYIDFQNSSGTELAYLGFGSSSTNNFYLQNAVSGADIYIQTAAGTGNVILNSSAGKVGIGTTSPAEFLEIKGDSSGKALAIYAPLAGNGAGSNISWYSDTTGSTKQTIGLFGVVNDGDNVRKGKAYLQLANGGTPGIVTTWTSDGNVGIGTMSPLLKFVVSNSGANGFEVNPVSGANAGTDILSYNRAGSAYTTMSLFGSDIRFNVNGNNEKMRIDANGNVGIGKNPLHKLDVAGDVYANDVKLTSDARFKKNLLPIDSPINKVMSLNGLSYEWKTDEYKDKGFAEGRHYGVIAQEIEKVLPEVVNTATDGTKAVAYTEIIPVLIEAIKEQQREIQALKKIVSEMR